MWLDDLVTLITGASLGTAAVDVFYSTSVKIPDGDGPFILINETGGSGTDETHDHVSQPAYQRPGAQVVVIARTYEAARVKAKLVYLALRIRNRSVNGIWYRDIKTLQEPFDGGLDPLNRSQVIFNVVGNKSFS